MSLIRELRRRNVFRVAVAYVVIAWLILQVGETLAPALRLPDWVNSALVFFLILGFPLAIFLAWVYELTPEGFKKEKDVDHSREANRVSGRKLDYLIIAFLSVAVAYFAVEKFASRPSKGAGQAQSTSPPEEVRNVPVTDTLAGAGKSIAVLPFTNMSSDPEQEYFSDGITEEVINALVKIPGISVPARTSVFAYKGRQQDVRDIGRELNVSHVLEGSIRSQGNLVRITAQLINVESGYHLWSESFDRQLENIFAVQEEIAAAIAGLLVGELGRGVMAVPNQTRDMDAYDLYLQGRAALRRRDEEAVELFERVTRADPGFAPGWAALAMAFNSILEDNAPAIEAAEHALSLDPDNVDALNAKGAALRSGLRWQEAEQVLEGALAIDPGSAELLEDYAEFLNYVGRSDEALKVTTRGLAIEPGLRPLFQEHIVALLSSGQADTARSLADREFRQKHDLRTWLYLIPVWLHSDGQQGPGHLPPAPEPDSTNSMSPGLRQLVSLLTPDHLAAPDQDWIGQLRFFVQNRAFTDQKPHWQSHIARLVLIYAGDIDFVLEQDLAALTSDDATLFREWGWIPMLAPLRQHPGFPEYLVKAGLVDYWDATSWPGWCRRGDAGEISCT